MPKKKPSIIVPPGWVTKREAMEITGKALKTVEQAIARTGVPTKYIDNHPKRPFPIYPRPAIEALFSPGAALTVRRPQSVAVRPPVIPVPPRRPAPPAPVAVSIIAQMHLVTAEQAHQLGYPLELLREWKNSGNPPGVRYGKRGFRFSVPALAERMKGLAF